MLSKFTTSGESSSSTITGMPSASFSEKFNEEFIYEDEGEGFLTGRSRESCPTKKTIKVGDSLPYGPRMYYETPENIVRMKDIGEKSRILVLGVLGAFTPDCWNRHLFRVLSKIKYYEERDVDYICCISTNDPFTQRAWAAYLGCEDSILMWADTTTRFTSALGMDVVIPWLDNKVRSKRYVILAEDMEVTKICVAPNDTSDMKWDCEHLTQESVEEEDSDDSSWD